MKERERAEAENRVRNWLEAAGAQFVAAEAHSGTAKEALSRHLAQPDFRVIAPRTLAIEVSRITSPNAASRKAKRGLSDRILLAEQFGADLPLVCILYGTHFAKTYDVPFADKTYHIDALPSLESLRPIPVERIVQQMLRDGDPGDPEVTDAPTLQKLWSRSIEPRKLLENETVARGTLAESIAGTVSRLVTPSTTTTAHEQMAQTHTFQNGLQTAWTRLDLHRAIKIAICEWVVARLGGVIRQSRVRLPAPQLSNIYVDADVWVAAQGTRVVLRTQSVSHAAELDKIRELVAEAWLLRALSKTALSDLLLLLNTATPASTPTSTIVGGHALTPSARAVNTLEAAGWRVFPWDFEEQQPSFMAHLEAADAR